MPVCSHFSTLARTTSRYKGSTVQALPVDEVIKSLRRHHLLHGKQRGCPHAAGDYARLNWRGEGTPHEHRFASGYDFPLATRWLISCNVFCLIAGSLIVLAHFAALFGSCPATSAAYCHAIQS